MKIYGFLEFLNSSALTTVESSPLPLGISQFDLKLPPPIGGGGQETIATQEFVSASTNKLLNFAAHYQGVIDGALIPGVEEDVAVDKFRHISPEPLIDLDELINRIADKREQKITRIKEHFFDLDTEYLNINLGINDLGRAVRIPSEKGHPGIMRLITSSDLKNGRVSLTSNGDEFVLSGTEVSYTFDTCFRFSFSDNYGDKDLQEFIGFGDGKNELPYNGLGLSIINREFKFLVINEGSTLTFDTEMLPNLAEWYHLTIHVDKSNDQSYFELNGRKFKQSMVMNDDPVGIQYLVNKNSYVEGSIYLDIDFCNITIDSN